MGRRWLCCAAILATLAGGCADRDPRRVVLSGKVTYLGRPVPIGYLIFEPDVGRGNSGPGGTAEVRDGRYQTSDGLGVMGGPYFITVSGFDGKPISANGMVDPYGMPLFQDRRWSVDLPRSSGEYDIQVPEGRSSNN